jgi:hypothetical protein
MAAIQLLLVAVCLLLASCATTQVLVEAPEAFWLTIERLILAVFEDVESVLLLLGL